MRQIDHFRFPFGSNVRDDTFASEKGSPYCGHNVTGEGMQSEFPLQQAQCDRSKLDVWGGFAVRKRMILDNGIENISGASISFPSLVTRRTRRKS